MADYTTNIQLLEVAQKLISSSEIHIATHAKPDGDAFGSTVALADALRRLGKNVVAWVMPPVPAHFDRLLGHDLTRVFDGQGGTSLGQPDLLILADTGAWSQVLPMRSEIERLLDKTLIIDHHLMGNVPAPWRHIDATAAACCQIVDRLIQKVQSSVTPAVDLYSPTVCEALFVGLASDTGWFRFPNTTPDTLELAARLLRRGVDHAELYSRLEQSERPEKLALQTRALQSLQIVAGGRAAVMVLRASDFDQTSARPDETERFVDAPQTIGSVQVTVLVTEQRDERKQQLGLPVIRLSFRSKHGPDAVDVAELAARIGGGGHARAAGARIQAPLEQALEQLSQLLASAFQSAPVAGIAPPPDVASATEQPAPPAASALPPATAVVPPRPTLVATPPVRVVPPQAEPAAPAPKGRLGKVLKKKVPLPPMLAAERNWNQRFHAGVALFIFPFLMFFPALGICRAVFPPSSVEAYRIWLVTFFCIYGSITVSCWTSSIQLAFSQIAALKILGIFFLLALGLSSGSLIFIFMM